MPVLSRFYFFARYFSTSSVPSAPPLGQRVCWRKRVSIPGGARLTWEERPLPPAFSCRRLTQRANELWLLLINKRRAPACFVLCKSDRTNVCARSPCRGLACWLRLFAEMTGLCQANILRVISKQFHESDGNRYSFLLITGA